jgi:ketosteroid isomerase-like protein
MKSKNLVSLSVSAVFLVLSVTGLLIYFGQGNHTVDHTHAWFGMLFFAAAVFHIINNWSSIKGYSVNRKAGGIRRELILPSLIVLLFTVGIAADWPVFKDLANAGKKLFPREKKKEMSQAAIDSIAQRVTADYTAAMNTGDTAAFAKSISSHATISTETGAVIKGDELLKSLKASADADKLAARVDHATAHGDNLIVAHGTATRANPAGATIGFTNVLTQEDRHWRIAAVQMALLPRQTQKVANW